MRGATIIGDVHLTTAAPCRAVADDLSRVVDESAGRLLVFAGDLLDLPLDSPHPAQDGARAVGLLAAYERLRIALGEHVERGDDVLLVAGNHDACVADDLVLDRLRDTLRLEGTARARVRATPWFARVGSVHVEHGHHHDPDNAPPHPLAAPIDGLGAMIVRRFIRPTGAHAFLGQTDGTPLGQLLRAVRTYGRHAPHVIARYFATAFEALLLSGPRYRARADRLQRGEMLAFARDHGLDEAVVDRLAHLGASPTLASLRRTFARLYFDRVGATLAMAAGAGMALAGASSAALWTSAGASVVLAASVLAGSNRYAGAAPESLRHAAVRTADATGASLVVYGHVHRTDEGDRYANTGPFGFASRPYLQIDDIDTGEGPPRVIRRWASSTGGTS